MRSKSSATAHLTDLRAGCLVLDRLPSGELAWLRPDPEPRQSQPRRSHVLPSRYWLTDHGRRAMALEALFGPWPTVAEACRLDGVA